MMNKAVYRLRAVSLLLLLAMLLAGVPLQPTSAAAQWADPAFQRLWQRSDAPVAEGKVARSWLWGPGPGRTNIETLNGKQVLVQYTDKARMELPDPAGDKNSQWYVTTGLLVSEMVQGKVVGPSGGKLPPANIPVAGDNPQPNPVTYASFQDRRGRAQNRVGEYTGELLLPDGKLGSFPVIDIYPPPLPKLVYYEPATGHNIPAEFWNFLNQSGKVYRNGALVDERLFDWVYVMGLPISEPYFVNTVIDGKQARVLVQMFERRTLTYDATAKPGWQVQMGNVGLHYLIWPEQPDPGSGNTDRPATSFNGDRFIRIGGDQFTYGGQPVKLKGSNYFNSINPWSLMWRRWDGYRVHSELSRISALGGNSVRITLPYDKDETRKLIWTDTRGRGDRINPEFIRRIGEFVQIASNYDLKVNISLFDWYDTAPAAGTPEEETNFAYLDAIVQAFAADDRVFAWDLHNEADNYDNWQTGKQAQVLNWAERMTARIHKLDPNHPVAISMGDYRNLSYKPAGGRSALEISDFVALHSYDAGAIGAQIDELKRQTGKPILLQEAGWPTGPVKTKNYDEATQTLFYRLAAEAVTSHNIGGWLQWSLYDYPPGSSSPGTRGDTGKQAFEDYFGLVRQDSSYKPAADLFRNYTTVGLPSARRADSPLTVAPKEEW